MTDFQSHKIRDVFMRVPDPARSGMLYLRDKLYEIAKTIPATKGLDESLKWGQPSYVPKSGIGTPLRLGQTDEGFGLFVHCQTTVISEFASLTSNVNIDGNRGVLFTSMDEVKGSNLEPMICHAMTYKTR